MPRRLVPQWVASIIRFFDFCLLGSFMRDTDCLNAAEPRRRKAAGVSGAFGLLAMLAVGLAVFFLPLKSWLSESSAIKAQLDGFGLAAPLVFVAAAGLLTAVGAPRLVVCSLAGMLFGASWGLAWSQVGTLLGAYATFVGVRAFGREPILRRYPQLDRYSERIRGRGFLAVLVIRQLPMNGFHNNLLLGLSPVRHRDFLLGSLVGFLPLGVTAVLIGAGVVQTDPTRLIQYATAGIAAFLLLGLLLKRLAGAARSAKPLEDQPLSANNGFD
jgi:uncharacterized membrane protein YdjX (TVP38/TMEM64 family)